MADKKELPPFVLGADDASLAGDLARLAELINTVSPGLGREIVVWICREFGGTCVYFLQPEKLFREARDRWIIQQYDAGHRVPEIARATGISDRQVWNVLGKDPGEDRKLKLF